MLFAFRVAKHVKSNAIVYAKDGATAGIGAGQMSRVDSPASPPGKPPKPPRRRASRKAWPKARGARRTPSSPSPTACWRRRRPGATAVIQPGGSIRDAEVIEAADEAGLAMVFTGIAISATEPGDTATISASGGTIRPAGAVKKTSPNQIKAVTS